MIFSKSFALFIYLFAFCLSSSAIRDVHYALDADAVGHINTATRISLKSSFPIPDNGELNLPLEISDESLIVDGNAPIKITDVNVYGLPDGSYAAGQVINITVTFTAPVVVHPFGALISSTPSCDTNTTTYSSENCTDDSGSVEYTSDEVVVPKLLLSTGCHSESCHTKEVQSFFCRAEGGKFAVILDLNTDQSTTTVSSSGYLTESTVGYGDIVSGGASIGQFASDNSPLARGYNQNTLDYRRFLTNVPANATQEEFKRLLEAIPGIEEVTVFFGAYDNAKLVPNRLSTKTLCTSKGNNVTVRFDQTSFIGLDGDVPPMRFDPLNAPLDVRTRRLLGDGSHLTHTSLGEDVDQDGVLSEAEGENPDGYYISAVAVEEVGGVKFDDREAVYESGSNSTELVFVYIVDVGDSTPDLEYVDETSLYLTDKDGYENDNVGGVFITGADGQQAVNLTLPTPGFGSSYRLNRGSSLGANKDIVISTQPPRVVSVTSYTPDGVYGTGEVISIVVVFSLPISVTGAPTVILETGRVDREAQFSYFRNNSVVFEYEIFDSDQSADLDYRSTDSLQLNEGTITRKATIAVTPADITLPSPSAVGSLAFNKDLVVFPIPPAVTHVNSTKLDGTYGAGELINITISFGFSETVPVSVVVFGRPTLSIDSGLNTLFTIITASNYSYNILFPEGHNLNDESVGSRLLINNRFMTIANISENTFTFFERYVGPDVIGGSPIVNVSTPGLRLAPIVGGNKTDTLIFQYRVVDGDISDDLTYTARNALSLGDGERIMRLSSGAPTTDANLTLPSPYGCRPSFGCSLAVNRDIVIDSRIPVILYVTTSKPSSFSPYGGGEEIDITVVFDLAVSVDPTAPGTPVLRMDTGAFAIYSFGSGTTNLTFIYTVRTSDYSLDFDVSNISTEITPLSADFGAIEGYIRQSSSFPTTDAILLMPIPGKKNSLSKGHDIIVDSTVAALSSVSGAIPDGTYGAGHHVVLAVQFTRAVTVNSTGTAPDGSDGGPPYFPLALDGGVEQNAVYRNGSGTEVLYFVYVVRPGDMTRTDVKKIDVVVSTRDVTSTTIIQRNHSLIQDAREDLVQRLAVVTLPHPGDFGSLSVNSRIRINTIPPRVVDIYATALDGTYTAGDTIDLEVVFSTDIAVGGSPSLLLETGTVDRYATYVGRKEDDLRTLLFTYSVGTDDFTSDLDYRDPFSLVFLGDGGGANNVSFIRRDSTNPTTDANLTLPINGAPGSLGYNNDIMLSAETPVVADFIRTSLENGTYGLAGRVQTIDIFHSDGELDNGAFALIYRTEQTECISAVPSELNTSTIANALMDIVDLVVNVTEVVRPYPRSRRFEIEFIVPDAGVAVLQSNLEGCEIFTCDGTICDDRGVVVNRDLSIGEDGLEDGVVEILINFNHDVVVNTTGGLPTLALALDGGLVRNATYAPARTQVVDVGVRGSGTVTAGQFRVEYDGELTECIDFSSNEGIGAFSLTNRLLAIPSAARVGLQSVEKVPMGFGNRYYITFAGGSPEQIFVPANDTENGACTAFIPADSIVEVPYTETVAFQYVLQAGDVASTLELASSSALQLNGGTIRREAEEPTIDVDLTLPGPFEAGSLSTTAEITIDCSPAPTIVNFTLSKYGGERYGEGEEMFFNVTMDRNVTIDTEFGAPLLLITLNEEGLYIPFFGLYGETMVFRYEVELGDNSTALSYFSTTCIDRNGAILKSGDFFNLVPAGLTLPSALDPYKFNLTLNARPVVVHAVVPYVVSLRSDKLNGTEYGGGEEIGVYVRFSDPVVIANFPRVLLDSDGRAIFATGAGNVQYFDVGVTDDPQRIRSGQYRLTYGGETTGCIDHNSTDSLLYQLSLLDSLVDFHPINVSGSVYRSGYRFIVTFTGQSVGPYGVYPLALGVYDDSGGGGGGTGFFNTTCEPFEPHYFEALPANTAEHFFLYTVDDLEESYPLDLDRPSAFELGTLGSIVRVATVPTTITNKTLPYPGSGATIANSVKLRVNATIPKVDRILSPTGSGSYSFGDEIVFNVIFTRPVVVAESDDTDDDGPQLRLETGGETAFAAADYVGGSGTTNFTFVYAVQRTDETDAIDVASSRALLGASSLFRLSSNPSTAVDNNIPIGPGQFGSITSRYNITLNSRRLRTAVDLVTSAVPDGVYGGGDVIPILVYFTRNISYSGSPPSLRIRLTTANGEGGYTLNSSTKAGDSTEYLEFRYRVQPADIARRLTYEDKNALKLTHYLPSVQNQTSFVDEDGRPVNYTLPKVGSRRSLSGQRNIQINAETPLVNVVTSPNPNGVYGAGSVIYIQVVFQLPVIILSGTPALMLKTGGAPNFDALASYVNGSTTNTLLFQYTVKPGDITLDLEYDGIGALDLYSPDVDIRADASTPVVVADLTLPSPQGRTLANTKDIRISTDYPVVTRTWTVDIEDGTYGAGEVINMVVQFDFPVVVTGTPVIYIETGNTYVVKRDTPNAVKVGKYVSDSRAVYVSGSGTDQLRFQYTVKEGDMVEQFDYIDTRGLTRQKFSRALDVSDGRSSIKRSSNFPITDALLFLPAPGRPGSLSYSSNITLDTSTPTVFRVTSAKANGVYSTGEIFNISVEFTQPVTLYDVNPVLLLETGSNRRQATYHYGNRSTMIYFTYVVVSGDSTPLLDYVDTNALELYPSLRASVGRNGYIRRSSDSPTTTAELSLPEPGPAPTLVGPYSIVGSGKKLAIQTNAIKVTGVTSPLADGIYGTGQRVQLYVNFSTNVRVKLFDDPDDSINGTRPSLLLDLTNKTGAANYTSGSGSDALLFVYEVVDGDFTADLSYFDINSLRSAFGSIVTDADDEDDQEAVVTLLPAPGRPGSLNANKDIAISTSPPVVTRVTTPLPDGNYGAGHNIHVLVYFDVPVIPLFEDAMELQLNVNGNNTALYTNSCSEAVPVVPAEALCFLYVVEEGDETTSKVPLDVDSDKALSGIVLLFSTDSQTVANLTLPRPGTVGSLSYSHRIVLDTTPPQVSSVESLSPDRTYSVASTIRVRVNFNHPVRVQKAAYASIAESVYMVMDVTGYHPTNATYVSGTGRRSLRFDMVVERLTGSSDLDYMGTDALRLLPGAYIRRRSDNPITDADLTLPERGSPGSLGGSSNMVIDTTAITVLNVSTTKRNGEYGVGEEILIDVTFTDPVVADGIPQMVLNAGGDAIAYYLRPKSNTTLTFLYTVGTGQNTDRLDFADRDAFTADAGTGASIESYEIPGHNAVLLLPVPGEYGSLASTSFIVIDTTRAQTSTVTSTKANDEYGAGEEITINVLFSNPIVVEGAEAYLILDTGDATISYNAPLVGGNGTSVLSYLYTVQQGDKSLDLDTINTCGTSLESTTGGNDTSTIAVQDCSSTNALVGTYLRKSTNSQQLANTAMPLPGTSQSLSFSKDIVIDTSPPQVQFVVSVRQPAVYTVGEIVDLQVVWDRPIVVAGVPRLLLDTTDEETANEVNATERYAYYDPAFSYQGFPYEAFAAAFVYEIRQSDSFSSLIYAHADALELNNGTIRRASTSPTTNALINLPEDDSGPSSSNFIQSLQAVLVGVYHESVEDLVVELHHGQRHCTLVNGSFVSRPSGTFVFGLPSSVIEPVNVRGGVTSTGSTAEGRIYSSPLLRAGIDQAAVAPPVGHDFSFADVVGYNLASNKVAVQSSTGFDGNANLAIDGDTSGLFSSGSVTHSSLEANPWWQLDLIEPKAIGTIRMFGRESEIDVPEVQIITLRATEALTGTFQLRSLVNDLNETTASISAKAPGSISEETEAKVGASLQSKLEALEGIGLVQVSTSGASDDPTATQRTYTVTFLTDKGNLEQLQVASNDLTSPNAEIIIATTTDGASSSGFSFNGDSVSLSSVFAPSYVMIFNETSDDVDNAMSLAEAKDLAAWTHYLDRTTDPRQVALKVGSLATGDPVWGQVIRIQLDATGFLSLAEVEVFGMQHEPVGEYRKSSPVRGTTEFRPFQSEESLTEAFTGEEVAGNWVLTVRDRAPLAYDRSYPSAPVRIRHGTGGISGYYLVITDVTGTTKRYYMDMFASIKTLPKYGFLTTVDEDSIGEADGLGRLLYNCYGTDVTGLNGVRSGYRRYRYCSQNYGVAFPKGLQRRGAVAEANRLRMGMSIFYIPRLGYRGPDLFTYTVTVGGIQSVESLPGRASLWSTARHAISTYNVGPTPAPTPSLLPRNETANVTYANATLLGIIEERVYGAEGVNLTDAEVEAALSKAYSTRLERRSTGVDLRANYTGARQGIAAVARVQTRECRVFDNGTRHVLCECVSERIDGFIDQQEDCYDAVQAVCTAAPIYGTRVAGLRVADNLRYSRICVACSTTARGVVVTKFSELTSNCMSELNKAGRSLELEGRCDDKYNLPLCKEETASQFAPEAYLR